VQHRFDMHATHMPERCSRDAPAVNLAESRAHQASLRPGSSACWVRLRPHTKGASRVRWGGAVHRTVAVAGVAAPRNRPHPMQTSFARRCRVWERPDTQRPRARR
jgi:hypothetical protein